MATTSGTPLWLDLRKEYIDDNFDKLVPYLQKCSQNERNDSFYDETINLFRLRIADLIENLSNRPLYSEDDNSDTSDFNAKLLATYLLADSKYSLALPAYVALMGELRKLNPRQTNAIFQSAIARLTNENILNLGYNWSDLSSIGTDVFAYKVCNQTKFDTPLNKPLCYSNYGTALISKNGIYLTNENEDNATKLLTSGTNSLDTGVGIMLRTTASEKLKQSHENNISEISEYLKNFLYDLYRVKNTAAAKKLPSYSLNDETVIKITYIDNNGVITAETVDPFYEKLTGTVKFKLKSIVSYTPNSFCKFFTPGNHFRATITDINTPAFNIEKCFIDYLVDRNRIWENEHQDFLCKLVETRPQFCIWINECGITMFTPNNDMYNVGDFALLKVNFYGTGKEHGKIYGHIIEPSEEYDFDEEEIRTDCLKSFAEYISAPKPAEIESETKSLSPSILKLLIRQMFVHQKTLLNPIERFRFLCNANVMAEIVGDDTSASYISFNSTYLKVLLQFVAKEDIGNISLEAEEEFHDSKETLIRLCVVQLLKEYGRKDNSETLSNTIETFQSDIPMLARLARLIQTANSMQGTLSDASINVIRREIIKTLSIETEYETDLEANSSSYLGVESGTQEFKTSMIFPSNNNMQPEERTQNLNVLRGICAFLNSTTGGVLYIGVNDQGYVTGIDNDMKFLRLKTIDSYLRYVQDTANKYFGMDCLPFLRIEALYNDSVVAIHVDSHTYRVVELEGKAYLRVNAESREMPESVRLNLISQKMLTNKNKAAAISHLHHAFSQKKCVILHNYASSNSGSVTNRFVEAFDIRPEDNLIVCYDRESKTDKKIKVFNINRIGWIEVLEDEPWKYTSAHTPVSVDDFHMTGASPIHIVLEMDLFCKNLLVEEYPATKNHLKQDKNNTNIWYYDANLFSVYGVGRFYMGLADRIKILEGKELKEHVKKFVSENFNLT